MIHLSDVIPNSAIVGLIFPKAIVLNDKVVGAVYYYPDDPETTLYLTLLSDYVSNDLNASVVRAIGGIFAQAMKIEGYRSETVPAENIHEEVNQERLSFKLAADVRKDRAIDEIASRLASRIIPALISTFSTWSQYNLV